ncbi:MAG TPA: GGDEF domain-containing protein [Burkholderiales bacterium]|nr:GGDEF domain-containing protein [Burkholderiales bacterium]
MKALRAIWSATDFPALEISRYAGEVMCREARQGVFALGMLTMLLMSGFAALYHALGMTSGYQYTFIVLAGLALHVALSARRLHDLKALYLLAMVLLALSGLACTLLAHRDGAFTATLFSTIVLLFMVVPVVPWGLREALAAVAVMYAIFTGSSVSVGGRFPPETLWTLQFLMLSAAMISLALVACAIVIRKGHLEARFKLSAANERLAQASLQDALTGAWNRRFLEQHFDEIAARFQAEGQGCVLAIVDVDRFKQLNDSRGHAFGDRVLRDVVEAMRRELDDDEYVVRVGGDEFIVVLRDDAARARLDRMCGALGEASLSIGAARVRAGERAPALGVLCERADKALYEAKARGRGRVCDARDEARAA